MKSQYVFRLHNIDKTDCRISGSLYKSIFVFVAFLYGFFVIFKVYAKKNP